MTSKIPLLLIALLAIASCSPKSDDAGARQNGEEQAEAPLSNGEKLGVILADERRSEEEKARDPFRHPAETLLFFDVEPTMTVVEIWPGAGWYANVIAPFLAQGGGTYVAAHFSPERSERSAAAVAAFREKFTQGGDPYGNVDITTLNNGGAIAEPGSADVVLTFRNVHNWLSNEHAQNNFDAFYAALKPGGVLGVVEHRADEDGDNKNGYVKELTVIELATKAGFEFDGRSEINANPKDTKNHSFGVWTLPPVRRSSEIRGQEDPNFDRAPYDAIGESDRMTLKFRKPIAADGALFK